MHCKKVQQVGEVGNMSDKWCHINRELYLLLNQIQDILLSLL